MINSQRSQYSNFNDGIKLYCSPDELDSETCVFNDINDPIELFTKIPDQNNPEAQKIKRIKFSNCYLDNLNSQLLQHVTVKYMMRH